MEPTPNPLRLLFESAAGPRHLFLARWLFLRALALIYFSAFFSLLFQIPGLLGPHGILPAGQTLAAIAQAAPSTRFWQAPTLFWLSSSNTALLTVSSLGMLTSLAATLNLSPRLSFFVCFVCFLSFVSAAGDFSGYQSDGMLLEAGFLALFFSPPGLRPRMALGHPPIRAALWLLQWEWFRIYFQSGLVKLLGGDPAWRHLTAMIGYYQNSPLPTWLGWYVGHLPRAFQVASAALTLFIEFFVVLLFFLPRSFDWARHARLVCFLIVTPWEIGVILTGNYAFLNYLVLSLGVLLLDDRALARFASRRSVLTRLQLFASLETRPFLEAQEPSQAVVLSGARGLRIPSPSPTESEKAAPPNSTTSSHAAPHLHAAALAFFPMLKLAGSTVLLCAVAYSTTAQFAAMLLPALPLPTAPIALLEPFRIANQYGLFAVMTRGRYEIEFQGSNDGVHWTAYPFRYKPQQLSERPRLYAPYQPRFDWNLWFASLGPWQQNEIVPLTEERLLDGSPDVLQLFRANPFPTAPPREVRALLFQYWFTSQPMHRLTGLWWRAEELGPYAPTLTRAAGGGFQALDDPAPLPRPRVRPEP